MLLIQLLLEAVQRMHAAFVLRGCGANIEAQPALVQHRVQSGKVARANVLHAVTYL